MARKDKGSNALLSFLFWGVLAFIRVVTNYCCTLFFNGFGRFGFSKFAFWSIISFHNHLRNRQYCPRYILFHPNMIATLLTIYCLGGIYFLSCIV